MHISKDKTFWLKIAVFAAAAVIMMLFLPRPQKVSLSYEKGRPWSNPQLLAPFNIPIYLDPETKQAHIDSIDAHFVPVFNRTTTPEQNLRDMVAGMDSLSQSQKNAVNNAVNRVYTHGVVDESVGQRIASGDLREVKINIDNVNKSEPTSRMRTSRQAYLYLDSVIGRSNPVLWRMLRDKKISNYLLPNLIEDEEESERLRNEMLQPVEAAVGIVQKGEEIINRGEMVTPQKYQILQTYEAELARMDKGKGASSFNITVGQLLFAGSVMLLIFLFLKLYRPEILGSMSRTLCLLVLLLGFFIFSVFMTHLFADGLYIVPFAILPILLVVFYDTTVALFMLVMEIAVCATVAVYPFEFLVIEFAAGMTAIYSLRELSRRSQLLRTAAYVFLAYVVTYAAVELMQVASLNSFSWKLIGFFAVNMVLTSFAYILIFIVEKLFGFISVVTLVELSDINNPLLRELSEECPGTFQHSMALANLVTNAAHRVNANVQLVRAGALYHDIGKVKNPAFFTENQHGVNPHNALDPIQSARIIISHVTDGLKRAEKAKLPKVIRDMIVQHHGKTTARYFYNTYCNSHPGEEVGPAPFTYPGPNPQSKEASLLMMADVVEAASRSLPDHNPETISALVNKLIDAQVNEGLHNDSPLSFRDITAIKESFIESLRTMYHVRIAYPDKKK